MTLLDKIRQFLGPEKRPAPEEKPSDPGFATGGASAAAAKTGPPEAEKQARTARLTPRERDLLLLLLEGYTLKESASRLDIKYSTANTHMTGLYKKLGVGSRAELIIQYRFAAEEGAAEAVRDNQAF